MFCSEVTALSGPVTGPESSGDIFTYVPDSDACTWLGFQLGNNQIAYMCPPLVPSSQHGSLRVVGLLALWFRDTEVTGPLIKEETITFYNMVLECTQHHFNCILPVSMNDKAA